jgi:hypothetical protein
MVMDDDDDDDHDDDDDDDDDHEGPSTSNKQRAKLEVQTTNPRRLMQAQSSRCTQKQQPMPKGSCIPKSVV